MYVCICHALTEKELEEALARSGGCARTTFRALGYRPRCGKCVDVIAAKTKAITGTSLGVPGVAPEEPPADKVPV